MRISKSRSHKGGGGNGPAWGKRQGPPWCVLSRERSDEESNQSSNLLRQKTLSRPETSLRTVAKQVLLARPLLGVPAGASAERSLTSWSESMLPMEGRRESGCRVGETPAAVTAAPRLPPARLKSRRSTKASARSTASRAAVTRRTVGVRGPTQVNTSPASVSKT